MLQQNQQDALEVELIRSLFEARGPALIMTGLFLVTGSLTAWQTRDPVLFALFAAGMAAMIVRLLVTALPRRETSGHDLPVERARLLQQRFTIAYFAFAVILGLFGCRALLLPDPRLHMLIVCLLVGYGAGVASSTELQPRIAIGSMLFATVPAFNAALTHLDPLYWATVLLAAGFLVGGIQSVRRRHARAVRSISRRLAFSTLARQDGLTALPNRLALREWFESHVTDADRPGMMAVHYLDLNGFKPVNDTHGHHAGDELLIAVSRRIARTIRATDTAARLGGDEFAVLQCDISGPEDAALLAQRLAHTIARPYRIGDQTVRISTCIGYIVAEHGAEDLECLLSLADEALYAGKRAGRSVTLWAPDLDESERAVA